MNMPGQTEDVTSYEQHVAANNQRLLSIAEGLTISSTFASGCRELVQWCSDQRAFCPAFENNLLTVLQGVVENANREDFDHELGVQLVAQCHTYRKHLSKNAATKINRWHEQFRRQKRNRKKKAAAEEERARAEAEQLNGIATTITVIDTGTLQTTPTCFASPTILSSFSSGCGAACEISAVVSSQNPEACAPSTTTMWPGGGPMPGPSPINSPTYPMPAQYGYGSAGRPMPPAGYTGPFPDTQGQMLYDQNAALYQQQVMMQQNAMRQRQMQQQRMAMMASQQQAGQQQIPQGMHPFDPSMYSAQGVPMATNRVPGQVRPIVPPGSGYPPGMAHPGSVPLPAGYPNPIPGAQARVGPPVLYRSMQHGGGPQQVMSYPNLNIPTEQLGAMNDIGSIPHIVLPREVLLRPFSLEHNVPTSSFSFTVTPEMYQQLQMPDMELQLKCYHKDDKKQSSQWPSKDNTMEPTVQICMNNELVPIRNRNFSLFLKTLSRVGENMIQFTVTHCVCSHVFVVQLVNRRPLHDIITEIIHRNQQAGLTAETCREKLRQLATQSAQGVRISLVDEKFRRRVNVPARSTKCAHTACFDLESFLNCFQDSALYECLICRATFSLSEIEVDQFIGQIARDSAPRNILEIVIDQTGAWKVPEQQMLPQVPASEQQQQQQQSNRKRENPEANGASSMKRMKSEPFGNAAINGMSPFGMTGPTSVPVPVVSQSPAGAELMSPYNSIVTGSFSPNKIPASSPAPARFVGGPGTPATPGCNPGGGASVPPVIHNPLSVGGFTQGTSPHHAQQNSQGETSSLAGSAPYTPASMSSGQGSLSTMSNPDIPFSNICNTSTETPDLLDVDDVFNATLLDENALSQYLVCWKCDKPADTAAYVEALNDVSQIISADSR